MTNSPRLHLGARLFRHGLTLLELLAVVALLGLVAGVGLTSLARSDQWSRLRAVEDTWCNLDALARLLARGGADSVTIRVDRSANTIDLRDGAGETVSRRTIPNGVVVEILVDGSTGPTDTLYLDGRGCSPDYHVTVRFVDGNSTRQCRVAGLTGWIDGGIEERAP